ncbi:MAG TPA: 8-oxoguanine deaminase [Gemmatimonadales bacterium]|nr:8-oxoguanine deaminase [Gemmatimonadales bacterium]
MSPRAPRPRSLLIRDVELLVTMDERDRRIPGGYLYAEDGEIRSVGARVPAGLRAERTIRAPFAIALPGLVNTHHHLCQTLTRAHPGAADAKLFDWLTTLYPVWAGLDEEAVHLAALVGMAELMLSGCTTTSDHHYLFPRGRTRLIDAEIAAARAIGIRFHATRGSMSVGRSKGGLPPDAVVQDEEEILADSERVIRAYHDPRRGAMLRVALAPCSPFSVSPRLMRETAELAERHEVRLHTHLAETLDEERYCLRRFKRRPVQFLADAGWLTDRTWIAHGVHFSRPEIRRLGRERIGVAHCPTSNMRLGSGIAPVHALAAAGCPVGLGVDGSASNDSSHLLAEARQALLLGRVARGADAVKVSDALRMATRGGAACLGRDDVGSLEPGRRADVALFDLRDPGYSGAGDPLLALLLCAPTRVHTLVVDGRPVIEDGELRTLALEPVLRRHRKVAARLLGGPRSRR